jgi:hypothetical protein
LRSVNAYFPPVFGIWFEFDYAGYQRKNGEVLAQADIVARMNAGTSLPDNYGPGIDVLTTKSLDAEPFACTIATVSGTASAFFMRHLNHLSLIYPGLIISSIAILV